MMSKSVSRGEAELHTGTRQWTRPGKSALAASIASERVFSSLTSTSFSSLEMVTYFSLPPFSFTRPSTTLKNSASSALIRSRVTAPSSAYSPILFGGLAQIGCPLTHVRLLPQVKPDDRSILWVDGSGDLLKDVLDALEGRLASGVDLVARDPVEVWSARQRVRQLLHFVELVGHGRG